MAEWYASEREAILYEIDPYIFPRFNNYNVYGIAKDILTREEGKGWRVDTKGEDIWDTIGRHEVA